MSSKEIIKKVSTVMAAISFSVFVIVLIISSAKSDWQTQTSVQNFKHYVSNMIKEQSYKIQLLLKKIQNNAQSVLENIDTIKQDSTKKRRLIDILKRKDSTHKSQLESPIMKTSLDVTDATEPRSFSHYQPTSYGSTGNANYGIPTYHHHSIGFDPINIMVSISLLSFLLQALQGLLTRTRLPTPVVEARSLNAIEDWMKNYEDKVKNDKFYVKKKYLNKYY